jgi:hypothetical protein
VLSTHNLVENSDITCCIDVSRQQGQKRYADSCPRTRLCITSPSQS